MNYWLTSALLPVAACVCYAEQAPMEWRGLHLDVSRHFFAPAVVQQLLDHMAGMNFNRLHLHLTDGPGWRLEIKRYPRLTEVGAWRKYLSRDREWGWADHEIGRHFSPCYGGFYTQEEMRGLIRYAAERGIQIVPEVDMPGHAYACLVAYPELALEPPPGCKVGRDVLATDKPEVRQFAKNVLAELMELFPPGTPIHLGGDEVDFHLLSREQQRSFMQEMVDFVHAHGRQAITWDEAAANGVRGQWVMLWRAEQMERILALQMPVILCPNSHFYFDYPQNREEAKPWERIITPETVRSFRLPDSPLVLGLQGNVWTERIFTPEQLFRKVLPRARAMAERFFSPPLHHNAKEGRLFRVLPLLFSHGGYPAGIKPQYSR